MIPAGTGGRPVRESRDTVESIDAERFPRVARYLAAVPGGLDGHPGCAVSRQVFEPYRRDHGALASASGLPRRVRALYAAGAALPELLPEVEFQAAFLAARDAYAGTDEAFCRWVGAISTEMFDRPVLRTLMRLVSPSLVVLGAARRWTAFHRGSELSTEPQEPIGDRSRSLATLRYPEALFPEFFAQALAASFEAAVRSSRGTHVLVRLVAYSGTQSRFDVSYRS